MNNDFVSQDQKEIQVIVFKLDNEEYAVPITSVQEIIMPQTATRIPKSPEFVEGVINLRGHIIPVIDGRKKFQLSGNKTENSNETRIMVLEVNNDTIGFIVDAVNEVVHLQVENIEPPPIEEDEDTSYIWGIGKFGERLLILVDHKKLLDFNESNQIMKAIKTTETVKQAKETVMSEKK